MQQRNEDFGVVLPDSEDRPKAPPQVIYCGPTNKSVDVVAASKCKVSNRAYNAFNLKLHSSAIRMDGWTQNAAQVCWLTGVYRQKCEFTLLRRRWAISKQKFMHSKPQ